MKTVYVSLIGGFGNQLFIYAFSRYLIKKYNVKVVLDTSFYQSSNIKIYLKKFNLKKIYFENIFIKKFKYLKYLQFFPYKSRHLLLKLFFHTKLKNIYFEKRVDLGYFFRKPHDLSYICNNKNFNINQIDYIYGYFQNEKYFKKNIDFEKGLIPISLVSKIKVQNIFKEINKDSSAMHIRSSESNDYNFSMVDQKYFREAIKKLKQKNILNFYIFSDNVKEAEKLIQKIDNFNNYKIVDTYSLSIIEEFYLMSLFKNIIISISTFSWWAAFLNHKNKKNIVQPSLWFKNSPVPKSMIIDKSIII